MMKFFSPFKVAVLIAVVIFTATSLWFKFNPTTESYETTDFSRIPTVENCQIIENPQKYDGKIIRIKSTIRGFLHGYYLDDGKCSDGNEEKKIAISLYPSNSSALQVALNKFNQPNKYRDSLDVVAVGQFFFVTKRGFSDSIHDRTSLHFEIYDLEYVAPLY